MAVRAWREVLADPGVLRRVPAEPAYLRLDATGEDAAVQHVLLALGGVVGAEPQPGQLVDPAAAHRGFLHALGEIGTLLSERPQWIPIAMPDRIAHVFDKRAFHATCRAQGVSVPPAIDVETVEDLMSELGVRPRPVFVKLRHASSASGLAVYFPGPRPKLMTTMRDTPRGRFNSLRVVRVDRPDRIEAALRFLIDQQGAHIEEAVPKARLDGSQLDCRVLMVAHEPAFVVVRQASHAITNLHLGGRRGRLKALFDACPEPVWRAAMADCRAISRWYGGLHLGIDVLFERGWSGHRILEANAFGDLLPGLTYSGWSVYETEALAAAEWSRNRR